MESWEDVVRYHEETKHHFHRYARSAGYMDWANQPDPFRRFDGAPLVSLPLIETDESPPYARVHLPGAVAPRPVNLVSIGQFFEFSLAISAWKAMGVSRWALRCNPSSGNLHPTEGYLVAGAVDGLYDSPAVYHYAPQAHGLERRTQFAAKMWHAWTAGYPAGTFFVGLASIHWREAWKYGERAYRYCQHDVGHALAAYAFAAAALGWRVMMCASPADEDVARLLGLDRDEDFADAERESADLLAVVVPNTCTERAAPAPLRDVIDRVANGEWQGRANRLSPNHVAWPLINHVAEACVKPATAPIREIPIAASPAAPRICAPTDATAWQIIRQRRSAQAMDGRTSISAEQFYDMLSCTIPTPGCAPWDALGAPVTIHLLLFVHRVVGLTPGLYCLVRAADQLERLRAAMAGPFVWERPTTSPEALPLYLLQEADCRKAAALVSCGQDIAGDGAFSLGMIADFAESLRGYGGWMYRRLYWETGVIGQVLYLEAEAAGVRGTGIGCFFDDGVHEIFGLGGHAYQSLYHFTVGGPLEDTRLTTLPPYGAERER